MHQRLPQPFIIIKKSTARVKLQILNIPIIKISNLRVQPTLYVQEVLSEYPAVLIINIISFFIEIMQNYSFWIPNLFFMSPILGAQSHK